MENFNYKHAPIVLERRDSTTDVMESITFTTINTQFIHYGKPSQIIPLLRSIGNEWGMNTKYLNHFNIAKRHLKRCVKYN